jgi:hypothetical protein
MKQGRFSDEQIVRILRETDKDSVAVVAKRLNRLLRSAYRTTFGPALYLPQKICSQPFETPIVSTSVDSVPLISAIPTAGQQRPSVSEANFLAL